MKAHCLLAVVMAALMGHAVPAKAAELGAPAGALEIQEWIKGEPLTLEKLKGKVAVVEFWATWCPPCRTSVPHLTELQKKYKGKAVIIGLSNESPDTVRRFVEQMGERMEYHVGIDRGDATANAYMNRYGASGIPWAFIVDQQGNMVWHDSPMSPVFEKALELTVAGSFEPEAFVAQQKKREEDLRKANDFLREMAAGENTPELQAQGVAALEAFHDDPMVLAQFALLLSSDDFKNKDLSLAERAAERAVNLTEGKASYALHAKSRVQEAEGNLAAAVATQQQALEMAESPEERELLQERLDALSNPRAKEAEAEEAN